LSREYGNGQYPGDIPVRQSLGWYQAAVRGSRQLSSAFYTTFVEEYLLTNNIFVLKKKAKKLKRAMTDR
jgi:hypothetical protein